MLGRLRSLPRRRPTPTGKKRQASGFIGVSSARFAGDMAVTFVATGGLTLSGGVLPRVVNFLDEAAFRQAFESKAPVDGLAKRIPTRLVMREDAVLVGMAAIASTPDRYGIDYGSRAWV